MLCLSVLPANQPFSSDRSFPNAVLVFKEANRVTLDMSFTSIMRGFHTAGDYSGYYGEPWSFKAVMSKQLKVGFQAQCLRKAYLVCCRYESWVISFTGVCSVSFKIQGSRDDLSTAGGFQSQTAMKHANSVDTSFSKDVLNSIAGINDRLNVHTG